MQSLSRSFAGAKDAAETHSELINLLRPSHEVLCERLMYTELQAL